MPELPEVETTRRGLLTKVIGQTILRVTVRDRRLRWPIPTNLEKLLEGRVVTGISRRGKYLLWDIEASSGGGILLCHLGMSGSLFTTRLSTPHAKHDHVDITLGNKVLVRYHDSRRFGAMLWIAGAIPSHPLLDTLGPEPLGDHFDGAHLFNASRERTVSIKEFIMNAHIVVGVGNIYASEALFAAGIRPTTPAGRVSHRRYDLLATAIQRTLARAIDAGGSSLRDYVKVNGEPGHFQLSANVYDCATKPCRVCGTLIKTIRQGQRSTYFCPHCQR
ncbi:MAG: bifunctional DNA-formamidopyrimidine glycosylase/DNA-(apurinic or apyrimidinic site) lyase [Pseudomonadota bacterium]